ncbi:unnamed protein product [Plutella xylostella]|uniref:(diamondback moth) hypothetical protein n=1 Tax=Plutella xylostella TaxID=51655 RepID=A0A8S4D2H0_PLUXY|nr:unnamed protein product [Plutella xylostella]
MWPPRLRGRDCRNNDMQCTRCPSPLPSRYPLSSWAPIFSQSWSLLLLLHVSLAAAAHFTSHIRVNTPAGSYSHGVGHPVGLARRRNTPRSFGRSRNLRYPASMSHSGYPRVRPSIPFTEEEAQRGNSISVLPWQYHNYHEVPIPLLPASPYKVDSPDPESLWPEGLFLPPLAPPTFGPQQYHGRRADDSLGNTVTEDKEFMDPYLLEGSEAVAAVQKAKLHGEFYFHDIPHIESLLANQELRSLNNLKPHRIASIRHTWPYNRP